LRVFLLKEIIVLINESAQKEVFTQKEFGRKGKEDVAKRILTKVL
jgi:hypothetical protein